MNKDIMEIINFNRELIRLYKNSSDYFVGDRVLKIITLLKQNIELYKQLKKSNLKKVSTTRIDKQISCLHFLWVNYENEDKEQEYWEIQYKRERELMAN